jgi:hypothetical protein
VLPGAPWNPDGPSTTVPRKASSLSVKRGRRSIGMVCRFGVMTMPTV